MRCSVPVEMLLRHLLLMLSNMEPYVSITRTHIAWIQNTPLIVPEVNIEKVNEHKGIIANPNCSTIQMVAALKPLQDRYGISRIIVSTYQAVSGAGSRAIDELLRQTQRSS